MSDESDMEKAERHTGGVEFEVVLLKVGVAKVALFDISWCGCSGGCLYRHLRININHDVVASIGHLGGQIRPGRSVGGD